jgi:hypothetical protein
MAVQAPERTSQHSDEDSRRGGPIRLTPRRSAKRHYLAVVAAEARRLGRQLRPPAATSPPAGRQDWS